MENEGSRTPPALPPLAPMAVWPAAATAAAPPLPDASLTEGQFMAIRQGAAAYRTVKGVAHVAGMSGSSTLTIGVLAVAVLVLMPPVTAVNAVIALGVCAIGVVELLGRKGIQRAEPSAARLLGFNQLAFLALITAYCVYQIATFSPKEFQEHMVSPDAQTALTQLPNMQALVKDLERAAPMLNAAFYGVVILLSVLMQGGLARYYFTRRKRIEAYRSATPAWVQRVLDETRA
jgi:hypothetical protein